ncbi:MAG: DUF2203 family protein [Candidatus Woesearchaeota archaeon]|nr:MAG: DUF2203 family protein [Candidatus Woesearchaeota archaeon]
MIVQTVEHVQQNIKRISAILKELIVLSKALDLLDDMDFSSDSEEEEVKALITVSKNEAKLRLQFYTEMEKLFKLGGIVRDLDSGILEFKVRHKQREVIVCYQYGESDLSGWYEEGERFVDKRPLRELDHQFEKKD